MLSSDGSMTFAGETSSPYYEWSDALFATDVTEGELERYLIPFKINEIEAAIAQVQTTKHDASFDAVAEQLKEALAQYEELKGKSIEAAESRAEKAKADQLAAKEKDDQEND